LPIGQLALHVQVHCFPAATSRGYFFVSMIAFDIPQVTRKENVYPKSS